MGIMISRQIKSIERIAAILGDVVFLVITGPYPRPRVTKLGPDDRVDWVIVSKPVLTAAINDTTFSTFQHIPKKNIMKFVTLVKKCTISQLSYASMSRRVFHRRLALTLGHKTR